MKNSLPTLAAEWGRGEYTITFYFVHEHTDAEQIRCVKIRCEDRHRMAKTLRRFRRARVTKDIANITEYGLRWLAQRVTVCYIHDEHHRRFTFSPVGADKTTKIAWWIPF